jgi:peptidoglycan/LPS O-acetylase OafA/YrhL
MTASAVRPEDRASAAAPSDLSLAPALRAAAVVLLFAGQAWLLRPYGDLEAWKPLSGLLRSGGLGVTVLLACSGFLVASWVLSSALTGPRAFRAALFRHFVPVLGVVALALVVVWFVALLDSSDPWGPDVTRASFEQVVGFNWNHYVASHALSVRADLVGLWYFSVEAQTLPVVALVAALLRRRPRLLVVVALLAVVLAEVGQGVLATQRGWFELSLWTATRGDAVVWGAAAAAVVHLLRSRGPLDEQVGRFAAQLAGSVVVLYVGLVFAMAWAGPMAQFRGLGAGTAAVTATVLAASALAQGPAAVLLLRDVGWLGDLGREWLVVVALMGPFLYTLGRNTGTWSPGSRLVVGVLMFVMVVYVVDQLVLPALRGPFARWETRVSGRPADPSA